MNKALMVMTAAGAFFLLTSVKSKAFGAVVKNQRIRGCDPNGCGNFGATRSGHSHQGIDIEAQPGEAIFAPIAGQVTRFPFPYAGDSRFTGIEITGSGHTIKIFYLKPTIAIGSTVLKGEQIGTAQDIRVKYGPAITPHVHLEVYTNGKLTDPTNLF